MAEKLWSLSNTLTGFNMAQALAYIYALGQGNFALKISAGPIPYFILIAGLIVNAFWIGAIWWCHYAAINYPADKDTSKERVDAFKRISLVATLFRTFIIFVFTVLSVSWAFMFKYHLLS